MKTPKETSPDFLWEIAANIAKAKAEILEQFLSNSNLEKHWKFITLKWTQVWVLLKLKIAKDSKTWEMLETFHFYLEEVKEPIHTLWIKINFDNSQVKVIPIFDKEVEEYLSKKSVKIIRESK